VNGTWVKSVANALITEGFFTLIELLEETESPDDY
jgi:hypothetical protein